MRLKRNLSIFIISIMMLSGCILTGSKETDKTFEEQAYDILLKSKLSYDMIADTVIQLKKDNLISSEDYSKIKKYGNIFADTHNAAVDTVVAYSAGKADKVDIANRMNAVSLALVKVLEIASPYLMKGGG